MSNETPLVPAVGDRVRILEIVAKLYDGPEMPSPGIVSDMVAMVGKEFPVTKIEDSKYGTLFQVDEWVFLREWIEVVRPGEGKEGAGLREAAEALITALAVPLHFDFEDPSSAQGWFGTVDDRVTDLRAALAAGPSPSSSQPLDSVEQDGRSRNEVLRYTAKSLRQLGRVFHAEDLEKAFPEAFAKRPAPSPESLGESK